MNCRIIALIGLVLGASSLGVAKNQAEPDAIDPNVYIMAGYQVEIASYDSKTQLYHLKRPDIPDADQLYARPKDVALAIKTLNWATLQKSPSSIVGNIYSTDRDLLLADEPPQPQVPPGAKLNPKPTPTKSPFAP